MLGRATAGLIAAAVLAASGCGSSSSDQASQQQKIQQVKDGIQRIARYVAQHQAFNGHRQPTSSGNDAKRVKYPYPSSTNSAGKMLGAGAGFVSSAVMEPETTGWTVSSGSRNTIVVAGGDARHPSDGLFSIIRTSYFIARQRINDVGVPGSGPVTITKAPLGRKIVVSAQKHGNIEFTSKSGITGTLHLKDDTLTLIR